MTLALVVGCASCVWDDVRAARALAKQAGVRFDKTYCVKLAGVYWADPFDVWVTLHPEFMAKYEEERKKRRLPNGYEVVAPLPGEVGDHGKKCPHARHVSYRYPGMTGSASSGIYGAKVALDDGHRAVLVGIPLQKTPHFARGEKPWLELGSFLPGFENSIPHMRGKVKSLSGLTREKLGAPDPEWLAVG